MRQEEERQQGGITVRKSDEKWPLEEQIVASGSRRDL